MGCSVFCQGGRSGVGALFIQTRPKWCWIPHWEHVLLKTGHSGVLGLWSAEFPVCTASSPPVRGKIYSFVQKFIRYLIKILHSLHSWRLRVTASNQRAKNCREKLQRTLLRSQNNFKIADREKIHKNITWLKLAPSHFRFKTRLACVHPPSPLKKNRPGGERWRMWHRRFKLNLIIMFFYFSCATKTRLSEQRRIRQIWKE